jgi:cell division protein FtsW
MQVLMAERASTKRSRQEKSLVPRLSTASWLLIILAALCVIGVVMVGSASSVISMSFYGSPWSIFFKELIWMVLGTIALVITIRVDYRKWRRWVPLILLGTLVLLFIVLVPGLGVTSGGSSRWVGFGQLRVQPSELMKLALALFGADLIAKRQENGASVRMMIGPLVAVAGLACALVIMQPDLGTAMVLMVITLALVFASGVPKQIILKGVLGTTALVTIAAVAMPYRRERLLSFIDPGSSASGSGYQVVQSLIGLGSGHLFGLGLGNSHEKWGLLPNAHTDFMFSIIGEELGLIGAFTVIVLIGIFVLKGLRAAEQAPDRFGGLLAVGLISWIGAEAMINIGAVLGALPVTGIPLPFISFGGSSLIITMAAAGMLINIARQGGATPKTTPKKKSARASSGNARTPATRTARPARTR